MASCRSCGAEIIWAQTEGGKAMPLDAKARMGAVVRRHPVSGNFLIERYEHVHESHFATCPYAGQNRKPVPKQEALFAGDGPLPVDPDEDVR